MAVLEQAFRSRLSVLIGRAGTAKTMVVRALLDAFRSHARLPGRLKKPRDRSKLVTQRRTQVRLRRGAAESNGMYRTSVRRQGWTAACT